MPHCNHASRPHSRCFGPDSRLAKYPRPPKIHLHSQESNSMNRKRIFVILAVVIALAATGPYAGWAHRDSSLEGSGTVEARNIRVVSKVRGRIDKVFVRGGDAVQPGQVLVTFDEK